MQSQNDYHGHTGRFPLAFIALAFVVFTVLVAMGLAMLFHSRHFIRGHDHGFAMMGRFGGCHMMLMIPIMLIVLVIIGYFVLRIFRRGGHCGHFSHYASVEEKETATEILQKRYVKGEITKEQFDQMKKDIAA
jgi:putative membrane protein